MILLFLIGIITYYHLGKVIWPCSSSNITAIKHQPWPHIIRSHLHLRSSPLIWPENQTLSSCFYWNILQKLWSSSHYIWLVRSSSCRLCFCLCQINSWINGDKRGAVRRDVVLGLPRAPCLSRGCPGVTLLLMTHQRWWKGLHQLTQRLGNGLLHLTHHQERGVHHLTPRQGNGL